MEFPVSYIIALATDIPSWLKISLDAAMEVVKMITIYHTAAQHIENIIAKGIFFIDIFISYVTCGITSKQTNIAGTASITEKKPLLFVKKGLQFWTSPFIILIPANKMPPIVNILVAIS